jgi:hypothetical protein
MLNFSDSERAQGLNKRPRLKEELTAGGTGTEVLEFRTRFKGGRSIMDAARAEMNLSEGIDRAIQRNLMERMDDRREYQVLVEVHITILVDPAQAQVGEFVSSAVLEGECTPGVQRKQDEQRVCRCG